MITISHQQYQQFGQQHQQQFSKVLGNKLASLRPVWYQQQSLTELDTMIAEVIQFAQTYEITMIEQIEQLVLLRIDHDFSFDLTQYQYYQIYANGMTEESRVRRFSACISNGIDLIQVELV